VDKNEPFEVKTLADVPKEPYKLLKDFEWSDVNVDDPPTVLVFLFFRSAHCSPREAHYSWMRCTLSSHKTTSRMMIACFVLITRVSFFAGMALFHLHDGTFLVTIFLRALKPPGFRREWHVGVRWTKTNKLMALITAVPATISVRDKCLPPLVAYCVYSIVPQDHSDG
jgi:hypothetical protein